MSNTRIPSPARSQGARITPRRQKPRRTLSVSSAKSNTSVRLTSIIQQYRNENMGSFALSPLVGRQSLLTDDTDIDEPRRKSWWKKLNENSRDVMEVLEDNNVVKETNHVLEEYLDIEVMSPEHKNYSLDLPDSSGSESIKSIVAPQRKLFTQKESLPQKKYGELVGTREKLDKLHKTKDGGLDIINGGTKELFQSNKQRSKPVYPSALLNISPNETAANKTKEMAAVEERCQVRNLFGQRPGHKRKNIYAEFIVSESEDEIPEIQPRVFSFPKKGESKTRGTSVIRGIREPSPTSSITTDLEMEDWKHLPSSTMVENQLEELLGGSTPVKRARLSKLSEAKETDPLTNISIIEDKTKQSNKSVSSKSRTKSSLTIKEKTLESNQSESTKNKSKISQNSKKENQNKSQNSFNNLHKSKLQSAKDLSNTKAENVNSQYKNDDLLQQNNKVMSEIEQNMDIDDDGNNFTLEYENESEAGTDQQNNNSQINQLVVNDNVPKITKKAISVQERDTNKSEPGTSTSNITEHHIIAQTENFEDKQNRNQNEIEKNLNESIEKANRSKEQNENQQIHNQRVDDEVANPNKEDFNETEEKPNQIQEVQNQSEDEEEHIETEKLNESQEAQNHSRKEGEEDQNESHEAQIEMEEQNESQKERSWSEDEVEQNESQEVHDDVEELVESQEALKQSGEEEDQNESEEVQNQSGEKEDQKERQELQIEVEEQNESQEEQSRSEDEVELNESYEVHDDVEELDESQEALNQSEDEEDQNESQEAQNEAEELDESQQVRNQSEDEEQYETEEQNESQQDQSGDGEDQNESREEQNESQIQNTSNEEELNVSQELQEQVEVNESEKEDIIREQSEEEMEYDDIEIDTPNVSHDTTGRNRNKDQSPEVVLHDKTNQIDSFTAQDQNTSVRKTKSIIKNLNIKPSLAPVRESRRISDGTTNSSAEGSGWDSHRTTRKTMRQTFGKDFTPRKSLRALVMEKSAKRRTANNELMSEASKFLPANSTEIPEYSNREDFNAIVEDSDHEVSMRTRQTTLETYLQKIKTKNMEDRLKSEEAVRNSLKYNVPAIVDVLNPFKVPAIPPRRPTKAQSKPKKQMKSSLITLEDLPQEVIEDMKYKPPKRFRPSNASWITKRLYKFLETKLEPKYDYKTRVRAEKLVETIYHFVKGLRRHRVAPSDSVDVLKHEMARLNIVKTHFEFDQFVFEYLPREVRIKVIPDLVNKIPLPRNGIFSDIIQGNAVHE